VLKWLPTLPSSTSRYEGTGGGGGGGGKGRVVVCLIDFGRAKDNRKSSYFPTQTAPAAPHREKETDGCTDSSCDTDGGRSSSKGGSGSGSGSGKVPIKEHNNDIEKGGNRAGKGLGESGDLNATGRVHKRERGTETGGAGGVSDSGSMGVCGSRLLREGALCYDLTVPSSARATAPVSGLVSGFDCRGTEERVLFVGDTGARTFACNEMTNLIELPSYCYVAAVIEEHGDDDEVAQAATESELGIGTETGSELGLRRGCRVKSVDLGREKEKVKEKNKEKEKEEEKDNKREKVKGSKVEAALISDRRSDRRRGKDAVVHTSVEEEKGEEEEEEEKESPALEMEALQCLMPWSYQVS
jgi:hypothetical protein